MKKVLIASTALVAATMLSAGTASASEKIKLNLGGFSKWFVVGVWNDDSFQNGGNAAASRSDYNSVDIKGNNEVWFGGSTTLDNGIKVGVDVQLEAGGHTDQGTDTIDESYVFVEGGFGKFIIGSENNGTYLLHVTAPDAAGNWNEDGIILGGQSLANPGTASVTAAGVSTITPLSATGNTTAIVTDGDADKITYVAPTFYGLTVGASYVPSSSEDNRNATNITNANGATAVSEIYGVGALYANTFGGVGIKVSAGGVTYHVEDFNGATAGGGVAGKSTVNEYAFGSQVSYAGFTLGGSYRKVSPDGNLKQLEGNAFDVGLQYASGPYAVSVSYYKSEVEGSTVGNAKDKIEVYQVSGKYTLGAGVDLLATVGHGKFEDGDNLATATANNEGWVAATGLSLSF